jgi:hypothetical protein
MAMEPNLLTNGGMERDADKDGVADGWFAEIHRQEGGEGFFNLDARTKRRGAFSQHIRHTSAKGWVRLSQDGIPAKPNARYLFRCWVKADCRFLLVVYAFRPDGNYDTFVIAEGNGTQGNQWQLFGDVVRTPPDASRFKVSLVTDSRGEAWFDETELIPLERPPYAFVPITDTAPKLDGDLSDPCWQDAEPLTPFLELGTGKIAEPATTAKLVATPTHLFVAFRCDEPNPQGMRLRTPESGEPAFTDDCVEVYLDPTHRHDGFWQFVATPKGNRWAQQIAPSQTAQVWWLLPRPTQRLITDGWQAATKISSDHWTAEIAIPFSLLGIQPQTGSIIGINLCRSRKAGRGMGDEGREQNSAFAYLADQTFQRPERFPHAVFVGTGDWGLKTDERQFVAPPQTTSPLTKLVPRPQRIVTRHKNSVVLRSPVRIVLPDGAAPLERMAATQLAQTLAQKGIAATITHHLPANASAIVLATLDRLPASLSAPLPLANLRTFLAQRGEEAYAMFVGTGDGGRGTKKRASNSVPVPPPTPRVPSVTVVGASPRGVFNGVQTLRQLLHNGAGGKVQGTVALPPCEIWDYPDLRLRGWHFVAPLRHELPFAEKLLDWLALMKFNTLVIEVDDRFPYERHPDIAHPQAMTKEQWRRFLAKARQLGFEVIPQVQTFGHFGYVLNKPAYRHLSEQSEPHPRWGFFAYCPSNPETYRLVFDLFDEVLEIFQPKWFHIGHDEITFVPIGVCERCKATGKTAWQLLADDIRRLYEHLKAKGVERVAMWCDQLHPDRTGGYAPYFTHFAADLIPKDIVQFCWHYDARQTFPWLTRLKDKGFEVVACGWYHAQNVWRFAAESFDRRALGYCGTTWYGVTGFATEVDLMTAVVLAAENAWSVDNPTIERTPHPTNLAQDLWALVGDRPRWADGVSAFQCIDLSPFVNAPLPQLGASASLRVDEPDVLKAGSLSFDGDGVPFRMKGAAGCLLAVALASDATPNELAPDLVAVPVNAKATTLYLLLTTTSRPVRTEDLYARGRTDPKKVATLLIRYADGSEVREELRYRRDLTEWNDRLGCSYARLVWQHKTTQGDLFTLCALEWRNPKPDVPIAFVALISASSPVQPCLLGITTGK